MKKRITQKKVFEIIEKDLFCNYARVRVIFNKEFTCMTFFTNDERYDDISKWDLEEELNFNNVGRNLTRKEVKESIRNFFTSYKK
jgi:hypothetical protein